MVEDVDVTYKQHNFDGSFSHPNVYRGDASPEVDAAWEAIGADCKPVRSMSLLLLILYSDMTMQVPADLAEKAGFTKENNVMINEKYGGGYFAIMEGIHHVHCLVRLISHPCLSGILTFV